MRHPIPHPSARHLASARTPRGTALLAALLLSATAPGLARAVPTQLVTNGEFETPACSSTPGYCGTPTLGAGWSTTNGNFELWVQGALTGTPEPPSPTIGSNGLPTGQHLEVNPETVTCTFTVPTGLASTTASFGFDSWLRLSGSGTYRVVGSSSGTLVPLTAMSLNTSTWTPHAHSFNVSPGETITITFVGVGSIGANPHIDQVSFVVDTSPSLPALPSATAAALMGLLGVSGVGVLRRRRRARAVFPNES